jgi:putative transcriptional regulator
MNENDIVTARGMPDGSLVHVLPDGKTRPFPDRDRADWARLEAMTEKKIEANALADPDNPPMTAEELAPLRVFPHPTHIRETLKLTQEQLSERFEIPLGTPRDWEQGVSWPDKAARTLLHVIEQDPEGVAKAPEQSYKAKPSAAR